MMNCEQELYQNTCQADMDINKLRVVEVTAPSRKMSRLHLGRLRCISKDMGQDSARSDNPTAGTLKPA